MSNINEMLLPGEQIVKTQRLDVPPGNLYLTTRRILFVRSWRLGVQNVQIPLEHARGIRKSLGFLYVTADKEYSFLVKAEAERWISEIQRVTQELQSSSRPSSFDEGLTRPRIRYTRPPPPPRRRAGRQCPSCGKSAMYIPQYQRHYCYRCKQYL